MGWFKFSIGRIPFLRNQFSRSPKFRWSFSH